jgi:hypothetical protein
VQRLAVIAHLKSGSHDDAQRLIQEGPPFDPAELGFDRHFVFLGGDDVVFVFEGENVHLVLDALANDPARSAAFAAWGPVLAGTPRLAHETYSWERGADPGR